jgi:hypothetical protein
VTAPSTSEHECYDERQASFFVIEDALKRLQPDTRFDEAGLLSAFEFES